MLHPIKPPSLRCPKVPRDGQGLPHEFDIWVTYPTYPNFYFYSDFSHFILRKVMLTFFLQKSRKKAKRIAKYWRGLTPNPQNWLGGRVPRGAASGDGVGRTRIWGKLVC